MKFNDAWDKAWDRTPEEARPKVNDKIDILIPKLFAMMWNIMAETIIKDGKILLDDTVYIDNNKQVVSVPLQKSSTQKTATKKTVKDKSVEEPDGAKPKESEPAKDN
jgi:hypothetical protein